MVDGDDDAFGGRQTADLIGDSALERVLGNAQAILVALDAKGRIVRVVPSGTSVLRFDELLASKTAFPSESFEPAGRVAALIAAALVGKATDPCFAALEDAGGDRSLWRIEAFPPEPSGETGAPGVLLLLVSLDRIAARDALDSALQGATLGERIERERLAAAQAVVVTIRHEINNALTSLIGYGDLVLRRSDRMDAPTTERVREMLEQAHRIRAVLDRIEGLARIRLAPYLEGVSMVDLGDETGAESEK